MAKLVFFDDYYLTSHTEVKRVYTQPQKKGEYHDDNASLQLYTSFFFDKNTKKYRLYYEAPIENKGTEVRRLLLAEGESVADFISGNVSVQNVCGLDDRHGMHGCSVTFDGKRYILLGNAHADDRQKRYFCKAFSDNGVDFYGLCPVFSQSDMNDYKDTYNSVYYNPYTMEYSATTRMATMDRRIALMTSTDGQNWSRPRLILHPYQENTQYYAMGVSHVDGIFYGLLWRFVTNGDPSDMNGYMENDLLYSYDGYCFTPTGLSPVCNRPDPPEYGCRQLWLLNAVTEGDNLILCGGATNIDHGARYGNSKFAITSFYSIRKDGFCALEGKGKNSIVCTKPFLLEGDIFVNLSANGRLLYAITDADGKVIEGYDFCDCVGFENADSTNKKLQFKNADIGALAGRRIKMKFMLDNAKLYSVTVDGRPFLHNFPQKSVNLPYKYEEK